MERLPLLLHLLLLPSICLSTLVGEGRGLGIKDDDYSDIYNNTLAKTLAEYAAATYEPNVTALFSWTCFKCNDLTMGFKMVDVIVDVEHRLLAYVGVAHNLNAIIVAFRGTQPLSLVNWILDSMWLKIDLNYLGMPDAKVHRGFYFAYHNTTIRPSVLNAVKRSREQLGNTHQVIVVGHSLGGALAAFCALDLSVNYRICKVQLMTFGQPRVGNGAFASYFHQHVHDAIRVTYNHDIVPHLPPYFHYLPTETYHHFPREMWIHKVELGSSDHIVSKICDSSGEDPSCSRSIHGDSVSDHMAYLDPKIYTCN